MFATNRYCRYCRYDRYRRRALTHRERSRRYSFHHYMPNWANAIDVPQRHTKRPHWALMPEPLDAVTRLSS